MAAIQVCGLVCSGETLRRNLLLPNLENRGSMFLETPALVYQITRRHVSVRPLYQSLRTDLQSHRL
jgi:hypothetical protein